MRPWSGRYRSMGALRFWQKTYLLVLALFLAALFGGVAFIGWQNQQQTFASEVEKARSDQRFVAQNLAQDLSALEGAGANLRASALVRSYGEHYAASGILVEVILDGEVLYSDIPGQGGAAAPEAVEGMQAWGRVDLDGAPFLMVSSALPDGLESYELVCARSLEGLEEAWSLMRSTLVFGGVGVSAVLAIALYFVLRSLSRPLEQLAGAADSFAAGDFAARARKRSDDELGMLADSLNAMADAAEGRIAEIGLIADANARMAANLSHEIRTPLTAVRGYAEYLLLADARSEERNSALAAIVEQSARLQAVSKSMLELSTVGQGGADFFQVDLTEAARMAIEALAPVAREAGVALEDASAFPVFVEGDEVLLESLVGNLVDNAVKACAPGGRVRVSVVGGGGRSAAVTVADDGRGLGPDELAKLGEPFYRPDKARSRAAGGAGLGVSLCYEIARLHGALLSYRSELGRGTVATVEFTDS